MKNFSWRNNNHIYFVLTIVVLFLIAVVNTYSFIGLTYDNSYNFLCSLRVNDVLEGREAFKDYIYFVRYFPTFLPHLAVISSIQIGITSVKYLLGIFTFAVYFSPIIFLTVIYFNIPKNKKNIFHVFLFSFLICTSYIEYFMLAEGYFTSLFLFIIFVIYFYVDFEKITVFNIFSLMVFSVFLISSHPQVVIYIPLLLFLGIFKYFKTKNIDLKNKIFINISFFLLMVAFCVNIYEILRPIADYEEYFHFMMLEDLNFINFMLTIFLIGLISFFNIKNKKIEIISITIIIFTIPYIVFNIQPIQGFSYRMITLYIPFMALLFLIISEIIKMKNINLKYMKITNLVLLFSLFVSTLLYAHKNNNFNSEISNYMLKNKSISGTRFIRDGIMNKYDLYGILLFCNVFPKEVKKCTISITRKEWERYHKSCVRKNRFEKFGICLKQVY